VENTKSFSAKLLSILDNALIGFALYDADLRYLEINKRLADINGIPRKAHIGRTPKEIIPQLWPVLESNFRLAMDSDQPVEDVMMSGQVPAGLGELRYWLVSYYPTHDENKSVNGAAVVVVDITDQKRAESQATFQAEILRNMSEGANLVRLADNTIVYTNPKFDEMMGYGPGELIGKDISIINAPTDKTPEEVKKEILDVLERTGEWHGEIKNVRKDGSFVWSSANISFFKHSEYGEVYVTTHNDISERKEIEESYQTILNNVNDSLYIHDFKGNILNVNENACKLLGYTRDELIGANLKMIDSEESAKLIKERTARVIAEGKGVFESDEVRKDGSLVPVEISAKLVSSAGAGLIQSFARDITNRRAADKALRNSEEKYRDIFVNATEGIVQSTIDGGIISVNPQFVQTLGYGSEDEFKKEVGNFKAAYIDPRDRQRLISKVLKELTITKFEVQMRKRDGAPVWLSINSRLATREGVSEPYLESIVVDISERKKTEDELKASRETLEKSLQGLVDTLARTVEVRDPYTAEHQRRVTDLSIAIANEAGLSANDIAGLRMAAAIHDIGKIFVPAETLNKPGKISAIEFALIKTHALAGYELVKDIKFEHPISDIIKQHHERLDGSGYPDGLKGDEIHQRAKIVAIADVVEAMCTHRPYRPALGIDVALAEIETNSGALYDPDFAAICLNLFRSKKFEF
jgi:PAS domain S-box-containing protein/putative nucleotidyltransferase with HDIG domain